MDLRFDLALKAICSEVSGKRFRWLIIGSTSLSLQGVKLNGEGVVPNDIDVLTDERTAYNMGKIFERYSLRSPSIVYCAGPDSEKPIFRSHFGQFEIGGVKVEIMGELEKRVNEKFVGKYGEWWRHSRRLDKPKLIRYRGMILPVSPLEDHLLAYRISCRQKDIRRYQPLKSYCEAVKPDLSSP